MAVSETRRRLHPLQCMTYSLSSLFIFSVWHGRYTRSCNLHPWHDRRHETNKEVIYGSTVIYAVRVFHPFVPPSHGLFLIYTTLSSFVVFLLCSSSMAWSSHGRRYEVLKSTPRDMVYDTKQIRKSCNLRRLFHRGMVDNTKQIRKSCNLCHLFHCGMVDDTRL